MGHFLGFLGNNAVLTTLLGGLVARADSLGLISNELRASLLGLGLVDVLHQDALVLENIALDLQVERVVHVLVNLASLAVLAKHPTKHTHASHPDDRRRHASLPCTATLARTAVTSFTLCFGHQTDTVARMHLLRLLDDQAILDELSDGLARVGVADFGSLVGVEPNLALASLEDASRETTLET